MKSHKSLPSCVVADTELCRSCDPCKKLKDAETRLALEDNPGESLRIEHATLKSAVNASHDWITARLPLEIASYIFQLYVNMPKPGQPKGDEVNYMTNAPFRLGAVSRAWRAVVWSSPRLWTTLAISICYTGNKPIPDLARQWLGRTSSSPLSICLYNLAQDFDLVDVEPEELIFIWEIIGVINSVSARWEWLSIQLVCKLLQRICGTGDEASPSILQDLCIVSSDEVFDMQDFVKNNPGHFPTHLTILNVRPSRQGAEWANLPHFEADCLTMEECLRVLEQALCLIDVIFRLDEDLLRDGTFNNHPGRTIKHTSLRSLSFREANSLSSATNLYAMINILTLPSLQDLVVSSSLDYANPTALIETLISLIGRSACQLKRLELGDYDGSAELLIRLLRITPSLIFLDVTDTEDARRGELLGHLMKTIIEDAEHSAFLPNLACFQTHIHNGFDDAWVGLLSLDAFEAGYDGHPWTFNRPHVDPPHSLAVHFRLMYSGSGAIPIDIICRLSKLCEQGIILAIFESGHNFIAKSLDFHVSQGEQFTYI